MWNVCPASSAVAMRKHSLVDSQRRLFISFHSPLSTLDYQIFFFPLSHLTRCSSSSLFFFLYVMSLSFASKENRESVENCRWKKNFTSLRMQDEIVFFSLQFMSNLIFFQLVLCVFFRITPNTLARFTFHPPSRRTEKNGMAQRKIANSSLCDIQINSAERSFSTFSLICTLLYAFFVYTICCCCLLYESLMCCPPFSTHHQGKARAIVH